jgi:hypothetical protein
MVTRHTISARTRGGILGPRELKSTVAVSSGDIVPKSDFGFSIRSACSVTGVLSDVGSAAEIQGKHETDRRGTNERAPHASNVAPQRSELRLGLEQQSDMLH